MHTKIQFIFNNQLESIDFAQSSYIPNTTVLQYLRKNLAFPGTKEGCAEGDCGACTVVLAQPASNGSIQYKAVNSCLIFLPKLHRKQLITVENLQDKTGKLHPVQQAIIDQFGSQCGFCTPGVVMSMFAYYKTYDHFEKTIFSDFMTGNLCRCTGYQSIYRAGEQAMRLKTADHFSGHESDIKQLFEKIPKESIRIKKDNYLYHLPVSLEDALNLRREYPEAVLMGGGTDKALQVTRDHNYISDIIDLSEISDLCKVQIRKNGFNIGSEVSIQELSDFSSSVLPALHDICSVFASRQIRNLATVGGNLATASPIGDLLPVLIAYEAVLLLQSPEQQRRIPLSDFILGYRETDLQQNELIHSIFIPIPSSGSIIRAYKISKRKDEDISTLSAAFRLILDKNTMISSIKIVYGGMAPTVVQAEITESFLKGRIWEKQTILEAAAILKDEFKPISDARSGEEFRRQAAANLLIKFWNDTQESNE